MSTKILHGSGPIPDTRLPASSERFSPFKDGQTLQSSNDLMKAESDISRILIVDDNLDFLKMVARMSRHLGYHPTTSEDALDALYCLSKAHYDLVITNYDMPFMDGYQLADQIKEKYFGTKVILMTGQSEQDVKDMLGGSGIVDGLLLKPFDLRTLQEKIEFTYYPRPERWTC